MIRKIILLTAALGLAAPIGISTPAKADPPPWAPAHGYRAKQHKHHGDKHRYNYRPREDIFVSNGSFLRCNRDTIGALIGAGSGAALGSTIGKGDGRTAAMIGGAILGMLGGYSIGQSLDQSDLACTGYTLQNVPDGRSVRWINPDSGNSYNVVPTRSWQNTSGRYCREYSATADIGGRQRETYGTACRQPDGSWQIVS
ncbi:RT0821/Lpp0805 family surface protein [Thalassospira sp. CH_XMU1448-2]|uniref:RT0821/Lpp0805 family surface protein n=1 Tax=Thalassospira sp. CH_XMU1448-2 TaxID=3107773 RepID=UPI0030081EC5